MNKVFRIPAYVFVIAFCIEFFVLGLYGEIYRGAYEFTALNILFAAVGSVILAAIIAGIALVCSIVYHWVKKTFPDK